MSDSVFIADGERFTPTEHARGPWDPRALHGGAPAALLTSVFERMEPGSELTIARLGFEFLRPIPMAPLTMSTRIARSGRRVQELAGELRAGEDLVCRASALRVQAVPADLPASGSPSAQPSSQDAIAPLAPPESGKRVRFALDGSDEASFGGSAMEMRWLSEPGALGPGRVWMRLGHPLLPGEPLTPLTCLAATADFGNGVGASLPFERFLFINADLTIHLHRPPLGEWIGLHARTLLYPGGTGIAESVVHDTSGPVGRAFQTLVVQRR
jgi:Thioesterase-like superfamily